MTSRPPRPDRRADLPAYIGLVAGQLFQSAGYAEVTMEQVASRAGVSKRTLYKYFPVKEALLAYTLEATLAEDLAGRDFGSHETAGFRAGVTQLLHESAAWCEGHVDVLLPYIRYKFASFDPRQVPAEDRGLLPLWTMLVDTAQDRGELAPDVPAGQLGIYFHYLYLGALMRWLTGPRLDLRGEFDVVVGLFMHGAATHRPRAAGKRTGRDVRKRPGNPRAARRPKAGA